MRSAKKRNYPVSPVVQNNIKKQIYKEKSNKKNKKYNRYTPIQKHVLIENIRYKLVSLVEACKMSGMTEAAGKFYWQQYRKKHKNCNNVNNLPRKKRVVDKKDCFKNSKKVIRVVISLPKHLPSNNENSLQKEALDPKLFFKSYTIDYNLPIPVENPSQGQKDVSYPMKVSARFSHQDQLQNSIN